MENKSAGVPRLRVCRHVRERVVAFLTVQHQASARQACKGMAEAVRCVSMENLLRATVLERCDGRLVIVAPSRFMSPFPSDDAVVEWSGGGIAALRRAANALSSS